MTTRINPSILAADFVNLQTELESVSSADYIHVDIMDNHFVPNLTFGQQMVSRIQTVSPKPLDLHLMISDVDRWAPEFAKLGVFSVTFHVEATEHPVDLAREIRSLGVRAGLAVKPATPVEPYLELLNEFDQFLVMTVEPGFGGQSFMANMMPKVELLSKSIKSGKSDIWLQVDGGIDEFTIREASASGADTFVAGSAIFKFEHRDKQIAALRAAAEQSGSSHQH
jgi:ribulose-phosphate 3-epimerase